MALHNPDPIIDFYDLQINGKDRRGRTRAQIIAWDDEELEYCHDYIQVLFPLPEPSQVSYNAPLITRKTLEAFRSSDGLRQSLCSAFIRMLSFYGLEASVELTPTAGPGNNDNTLPAQAQKTSTAESASSVEDSHQPSGDLKTRTVLSAELSNVANAWHVMDTFQVTRGPTFRKRASNWCVSIDHNHLRITRILRCLRVLGLQKQCEAFFEALKMVYNDANVSISQSSMKYWTRAVREPVHIAPDGMQCRWLKNWQEENHSLD